MSDTPKWVETSSLWKPIITILAHLSELSGNDYMALVFFSDSPALSDIDWDGIAAIPYAPSRGEQLLLDLAHNLWGGKTLCDPSAWRAYLDNKNFPFMLRVLGMTRGYTVECNHD